MSTVLLRARLVGRWNGWLTGLTGLLLSGIVAADAGPLRIPFKLVILLVGVSGTFVNEENVGLRSLESLLLMLPVREPVVEAVPSSIFGFELSENWLLTGLALFTVANVTCFRLPESDETLLEMLSLRWSSRDGVGESLMKEVSEICDGRLLIALLTTHEVEIDTMSGFLVV